MDTRVGGKMIGRFLARVFAPSPAFLRAFAPTFSRVAPSATRMLAPRLVVTAQVRSSPCGAQESIGPAWAKGSNNSKDGLLLAAALGSAVVVGAAAAAPPSTCTGTKATAAELPSDEPSAVRYFLSHEQRCGGAWLSAYFKKYHPGTAEAKTGVPKTILVNAMKSICYKHGIGTPPCNAEAAAVTLLGLPPLPADSVLVDPDHLTIHPLDCPPPLEMPSLAEALAVVPPAAVADSGALAVAVAVPPTDDWQCHAVTNARRVRLAEVLVHHDPECREFYLRCMRGVPAGAVAGSGSSGSAALNYLSSHGMVAATNSAESIFNEASPLFKLYWNTEFKPVNRYSHDATLGVNHLDPSKVRVGLCGLCSAHALARAATLDPPHSMCI
jgi:hypothetical protein